MVKTLTPEQRSVIMSHVRSKNTKPELMVRRMVRAWGYRYRIHVRELPGCPDLVFTKHKKVIFIHGCFWHWHEGCPNCRLPKTKLDFWLPKLEDNKRRDQKNQDELRKQGWKVLVIWECELGDRPALMNRIRSFLEEETLEGDE